MKKEENIIVSKTYSFAVRIVRFCFEIQDKRKEYVISRQLLKSGTSIGANVEEARELYPKPSLLLNFKLPGKKPERRIIGSD